MCTVRVEHLARGVAPSPFLSPSCARATRIGSVIAVFLSMLPG